MQYEPEVFLNYSEGANRCQYQLKSNVAIFTWTAEPQMMH